MLCLGCGEDLIDARVRRSLETDSCQHVVPLWSQLFNDELQSREMDALPSQLLRSGGKMCRRCFQTFERCTKLLDTVKSNVKKAVSTLQLQDSFSLH